MSTSTSLGFYDSSVWHHLKRKPSHFHQQLASILAIWFAGSAVVLIVIWARGPLTQYYYLGGFTYATIGNWHSVMMVSGLVFGLVNALVSYRLYSFGKTINKIIHACFHTGILVCISIALYCVVRSHKEKNVANMFSSHSFMGITALSLYGQNYIFGAIFFLFPTPFTARVKQMYMNFHIPLGLLTMMAVACAVQSGIASSTFVKCNRGPVTKEDTNPAENYMRLLTGCRLIFGVSMLVMLAFLCTAFAIIDISGPKISGGDKYQAQDGNASKTFPDPETAKEHI